MGTFEFNEEAARRLEILYSTPDVRGQREEALRQLRLRAGEAVYRATRAARRKPT